MAAGLAQHLPRAVNKRFQKQAFPFAAGGLAMTEQAGREHAGVVQNE
jgi:hypothetical protein